MKRIIAVIMIIGLLFSAFAEVSKPSLDGRAKVAEVGELPVGLFAKSASFLPGDTVIVTNPATKISIEVMIFGNIGSSEGIAVVLSPEAARELYITKGSNVIVQVTKKSDNYAESSILAKTLQSYTPEVPVEEYEEPVFDEPSEAVEEYVFYKPEEEVSETLEPVEEPVFEEELPVEEEQPVEVIDVEPEPVEPVEEVAFEEPEWPSEVVEAETEIGPEDEIAFEEPEWPAEVIEVEPEPVEPAEEVAFEEPEWPAEEADIEEEPLEEEPEIVYVEAMDDQPVEEEPVIEYVEILPEENENFIEETEIALIPADPNPPVYEDIIQEEPEVVIIPIFEEEPVVISEPEEEPVAEEPVVEEPIEVLPVVVEEPEVLPVFEPKPVVAVEIPAVESVTIPYGEIVAGNWYIQIATCSKLESVENIVKQYGKKYPLVVVKLDSGDMRVLVGALSSDEYPTILARFKAFGFKDAFARSK